MHRFGVMPAVTVLLVVLAGCGGGGGGVLDLGDNTIIQPPVGTAATTPTVAKFGPIANYLPPSGTIITYKVASLLRVNTQVIRLQFLAYDNTKGTMTLDVRFFTGGIEKKHIKLIGTIKVIGGESYCVRRKKVYVGGGGSDQITTFSPGVLMGLFDSTPASKVCNFTMTGHSTGSRSLTMKYKGTQTVNAGGSSYNCVVSECANFITGDLSTMQVYWAPGAGPVMAGLTPAMRLTQAKTVHFPRWTQLGSVQAESIVAEAP